MTERLMDGAWESIARGFRQPELGLTRSFPQPAFNLSLLDALGNPDVAATRNAATQGGEIGGRISGLLEQLQLFETISRCPILAITGLLNAGKSSLLATYLSSANRPRVLRGLGNQHGTHRFVLWLPQVWWDEPNLHNGLIGLVSSIFGHAPERLSDDPQEAFQQYNGRVLSHSLMCGEKARESRMMDENQGAAIVDPMSVPLVAYDEQLNELRLGLVDCPDIQTGFISASDRSHGSAALRPGEVADLRREHLARIGRLCSAFIVVSKLSSLHDQGLLQILTTLRDAMPGVPRMLAINKIKSRYAPQTVAEEARGLVDRFGLDAVFGAYDYRSALAATRIPARPAHMAVDDSEQPIFFQLDSATTRQSAEQSADYQYLFDLGDRLDAGQLSLASSRSLIWQLKAQTILGLQWLDDNQQQRQQQIRDAWQTIADACYEFMAERDTSGKAIGLRLQASPAIIAQMAHCLQRTAPTWMRIGLSIDRTARQFQQAISNSATRFSILKNASESVTQFTKRFRRGEGAQVVTPERLAESLRECDRHDSLEQLASDSLVARCELAMRRFADENKTLLDDAELTKWSEKVWQDMSWRDKLWKGAQPLAVMLAPLLAVVLIPFDGGGSAVLVFASTKELLAAAGLAALLGPATTGGETLSIIHRETPWRQLSDLFAICCDCVGLPRPLNNSQMPSVKCAGSPRSLLLSQLEIKPGTFPPALQYWESRADQVQVLRGLLV